MRPFYPTDFLNFLNETTGQVGLALGVCRGLLYNALGAAMVTEGGRRGPRPTWGVVSSEGYPLEKTILFRYKF